jgi:hypothetical protein
MEKRLKTTPIADLNKTAFSSRKAVFDSLHNNNSQYVFARRALALSAEAIPYYEESASARQECLAATWFILRFAAYTTKRLYREGIIAN